MSTRTSLALLIALIALVSASCHSSDDDPATPAPAPSGNSFVLGAVQQTSETSEPVAINDQELTFSEDPHAFDSLFQ